jgi:hypothetical protein
MKVQPVLIALTFVCSTGTTDARATGGEGTVSSLRLKNEDGREKVIEP